MCPTCITTALLTAVGASSTAGLTALALKKLCWKSKRNRQTGETENANRSNGTKKKGVNRLEDLSGDSAFYKDDSGEIFRTCSTFGRGGEQFLGIYGYLDVMRKGRNENGPYHSLTDWARPRNKYGKAGDVEANGRYHVPSCGCTAHKP